MTAEEYYEATYWADYEAQLLIDWQRYEEENLDREIEKVLEAKIIKLYPDAD